MITQERLKHLLSYDSETGVFTRRTTYKRWREGRIAGGPGGDGKKGRPYWVILIDGRRYFAQQLAWLYVHGEWHKEFDHKDRNGRNNAISNLRPCTRGPNNVNTQRSAIPISGFRGVSFNQYGRNGKERRKQFQAKIGVNKRVISLGYYESAEDAHKVYVKAAQRYYGEFADIHRLALEENDGKAGKTLIAPNH